MIYAGIGSRETPAEVRQEFIWFAEQAAWQNWKLRTGGARGADMAFLTGYRGVKADDSLLELFLPWPGYNGIFTSPGTVGQATSRAIHHAARFHPKWAACSTSARLLHARNSHIILGLDLNTPVDLIVCWTKDGLGLGGTGQALRVADHHNIPILDLGLSKDTHEIKNRLKFVLDGYDAGEARA